jgi:pyruvate kinase
MPEGPRVVKVRPKRGAAGAVEEAARVWLTPDPSSPAATDAEPRLPLPPDFVSRLRPGDTLHFHDTRGRARSLTVEAADGVARLATIRKTAYVGTGTVLKLDNGNGPETAARIGVLPPVDQFIVLKKGDRLKLLRDPAPGRSAVLDAQKKVVEPASIPCTLPEVFSTVKPGERIWFDDGKIGGVIRTVSADELDVEITSAKLTGEKLRADKGINLPDSDLTLPPLTPKDLKDLAFIVKNADIVGYSFVRKGRNVRDLQDKLEQTPRPRRRYAPRRSAARPREPTGTHQSSPPHRQSSTEWSHPLRSATSCSAG